MICVYWPMICWFLAKRAPAITQTREKVGAFTLEVFGAALEALPPAHLVPDPNGIGGVIAFIMFLPSLCVSGVGLIATCFWLILRLLAMIGGFLARSKLCLVLTATTGAGCSYFHSWHERWKAYWNRRYAIETSVLRQQFDTHLPITSPDMRDLTRSYVDFVNDD